MIQVSEKGIYVSGLHGTKAEKMLWDMLYVVGHRFVAVALTDEEIEGAELLSNGETNLALLPFSSEDEFCNVVARLSDYCITDFFITVNSYMDNIKQAISSRSMLNGEGFDEHSYLNEFPKTIHVKENELFVDMSLFKAYDFQLKRVAQRYMKR